MNSGRRAHARKTAERMLDAHPTGPFSILVRPHLLTPSVIVRVLRDVGGRGVRVVLGARGIRYVEMRATAKTFTFEFRDALWERLMKEAHKVPEGLEFPRGNWW